METINGALVISQIMNDMSHSTSEWRDWDNVWDEGPWDKESWSNAWEDSHG